MDSSVSAKRLSAMTDAVTAWRSALPARLLPEEKFDRYRTNCLSIARRIIAAIQPETEAEIVEAVRIANEYRIPLYTISTGHNWGYGTSAPVVDDCAILDLSRMTKISDFDPEVGLITLEPGVTQQQLFDFLAEQKADFYVPTTGAGPTASIVGNALEHGFGMTPHGDHFQSVTAVRAVLADGSLYQSYAADTGSSNAGVWKWGIGPYLDGLFAQGNAGIVTSLQIALAPHAEHTEAFVFFVQRDEDLEPLLNACKTLLTDMHGVVGSIKIMNRKSQEHMTGAIQEASLAGNFSWMGTGIFRCRKTMISPIRKEIRRTLKMHTSRLLFINDRRNALLSALFRWIPGKTGASLRKQAGSLHYLMNIVNGVPSPNALRLAYQHVPVPAAITDPVADGVGIFWYAPIIAMKTGLLLSMIGMIEEVLAKHGFPETVSFTTLDAACAIGVIPIVYDKNGGAEKAHACYKELWARGNALGCPPYRMNTGMMDQLTDPTHSVFWQTAGKIKNALDPNQILSPGRYAPTV